MIGSRAWFALMRRNFVYRKRNYMTTFLELMLPVLGVCILILIKNATSGDGLEAELIPASFPGDNNSTFTPLSFNDYLTAIQAKRVCVDDGNGTFTISGMNPNSYNWQVPLVKCDSQFCTEDGQDAASTVCEYNIIGITGNVDRVAEFVSYLGERYPILNNQKDYFPFEYSLIRQFESSDEMSQYVTSSQYGEYPGNPKLAMGIVFNNNDPNVYDYSLRQNSTNYNALEEESRPASLTTPDTKVITDNFGKNDQSVCVPIDGAPILGPFQSSCTGQYMYNGILTFQRLVQDFIIDITGAATTNFVSEAGVQFVPFPSQSYKDTGFYQTIEGYGPLIITLGLLLPVAAMTSYIAQEKELRQKELMKMMSVTESDIGWSWFVTFMILNVITATLVALVSDVFYEESEFLVLWIFWLLTFTSIVVFCMTIASVASKAIRAVFLGILLFFCGAFITILVDLDGEANLIAILSLHPVAAFSYGLAQIGRLEDNGIGLSFDTIDLSTGNVNGYTFGDTLRALMFDCLFWGLWTWYLNRVIKPDYGQALPFYFPFSMSYWCPSRLMHPVSDNNDAGSQNFQMTSDIPYEPVGDVLRRQASEGKSIEIHNLRKEFGEKAAVDGLNLSMYSGQITALLGHNGAGKTTTIAMLTGALAPSSGYATVAGKDVRTQMQDIRQDIGICLQHDCLFPILTVREHLQFFSRLKGLYDKVSKEEAEEQIDQAIRDVALFEKRNTYSMSLSGGMKRKLSVAIAFSGGSKVVILDEPTSGMDPFSRRFTWNVIRQYRQDRCIILTTHFMDEAEILGDRIAIMASGRLSCAGTSLFLKKTYGVGYQLTIEKNHEHANESPNQIEGNLNSIIKSAVPSSSLLNSTGTEIRYQLPLAGAQNFPMMFAGLDEKIEQGNIQSYGVSMTTLDEVFYLVTRGDHANESKPVLASSKKLLTNNDLDDVELNPTKASTNERPNHSVRLDLEQDGLFVRHVLALTKKRAANFSRDKKAWCCTTFAPTVAVLFGLISVTILSNQRDLIPVTLSLNELNKDVVNAPVNPVSYNSPSNPFACQPGSCSYDPPVIYSEETNELYGFCGWVTRSINASNPNWFNNNSCSIAVSTEVMMSLNPNATAIEMNGIDNVLNSSFSLFGTSDVYQATQYGAILFTHDQSSVVAETGLNFSTTVIEQCQNNSAMANYTSSADCETYGGIGYVIQYNFTALHVAPLFQALADEAIVRQATNNDQFEIKVTIAPLPLTSYESGLGDSEDSTFLFVLVVLSFPMIAGSFGAFIVLERESKAKHLQTVAGVDPWAYWLSSFIFDVINYQIPLWITIALFFLFGMDLLTTSNRDAFSGIVALLFLYGPAATSFTYCLTFAFTSPSVCTMVSIISGFLIGMGGPIAVFILTLIANDPGNPKPNLEDIANVISWILRIFTPSFCLGKGILWVLNMDTIEYIEADPDISAWKSSVLGLEVLFLGIQTVVYFVLAVKLDQWSTNPAMMSLWKRITAFICCKWCGRRSSDPDIEYESLDDSDVVTEEERVLSGEANNELIVLDQLTKVFDNGKKAVNKVSLGIPPGQCFGLLGINGAGKTTTMSILTAEFPPSTGDATLAGFSVTKQPEKTRRRIGYCPQFDAHFANMTGREHIELYASIKGIPKNAVKDAVAEKLREVGLNDFDNDRLCSNYSGGMKRRLSLAIATIGSPQILFLDECSTGVDPVARREIWQMVSDMVVNDAIPYEERTSVILTTHSMEECEALCPRIGIMANGKLRCLGSAQHLKNKFGQGFQVELKIDVLNVVDDDYKSIVESLAACKGVPQINHDDVFFTFEETLSALQNLTEDDSISSMITPDNTYGYNIWREAQSSVGVPLDALAAFATSELRMQGLSSYMEITFPDSTLRERQDLRVRYEVSSTGTKISEIFESIEAHKEDLHLVDYGVSQTSLEQVFNMHAAEAEKLKQGRNDG